MDTKLPKDTSINGFGINGNLCYLRPSGKARKLLAGIPLLGSLFFCKYY